ncbi:aliphatic sulfonate ABC transporter permease SsuC [Undibacterium jejuense]|uniref:Aliphatic sulfonate ABC transporter permease SsuC n=1 Tax=Undibacterium jejuense TaxID=1344949 RepID=A0A923HQH6_9BURK|nr:aliphatic sulfonate ABC transporter permease SsuC [Undibacterium jejuense]MBC3862853.1 aliphatic sulfonate ABC transporter permease SsuC [Undibacterium jejuense]
MGPFITDISPERSNAEVPQAGFSAQPNQVLSADLHALVAHAGRFVRHLKPWLLPWLVPIILLVTWQLAAQFGYLSSRILPEPLAVLKAFWSLIISGEIFIHVKTSLWRAISGFLVGGGLGLLLGLFTGTFKFAETLLDSSLQMIRNIPALALMPLVILWFGIDETAKLFLVSVGVFFPVYLNTFHGIRSVDKGLIEMARSYGLSGWALYRDVILPGALPSILVGVRFALGLVWVLLIVAETISSQSGIGYMTMNAREFLQTDVVLVGILLYALLGKLADSLSRAVEHYTLRWHPGYQRKNQHG